MNQTAMRSSVLSLAFAAASIAAAPAALAVTVEIAPAWKGDRTVQVAKAEFAKFHRMITGREAAGGQRLLLTVDSAISADGRDAFTVRSDAKGAVVVGGNPRSVLYAVYDLLEKRGGCRWFWDGDVVPSRPELDLSNLDVNERSRFKYRACRYFAHRGLTRFRALQWGPDEWKREIDYLCKMKVNVFMMRLGWYDLFQKAFPGVCPYPDPAVRLPGTRSGYDDQSLHWSLQYRGLLRKTVMDYGFERGLMQPEDFGTMTHWYTRTPKSFLDAMKPDFLPNAVDWYDDPSALVWDIRKPKWMEMYWKLTETAIREYGRPDILHTMGLSERKCSDDPAENLRLKIEVTRRLLDDAKHRHPESLIILGGWDFHFTWEPEECRQLFAALKGYDNVVLWDYASDEAREGGIVNRRLDESILSNWDVIGKFPYTFGVFGHATSCTDIRADYPRIEREWAKCRDDPKCVGYIWWGETEHNDILWYEYFSKNAWSPRHTVEELIPGFCRDRYGREAAKMEEIWRKALPITIGHGYGHLFMNVLLKLPSCLEKERSFRTFPWRRCLNDAPAVFRGLADVAWESPMAKRDTIDVARTVADRLIYANLSKLRVALAEWRGEADNADEVRRHLLSARALVDAFADALALHTDYSLWESFLRLDAVENVRNRDFPRTLLDNAINDYCVGYQYEAAEHWYRRVAADVEKAVSALLDSGDRRAKLAIPRTDYRAWMLGTPLHEMAPALPRTAENYRETMLKLAEAAEIACPREPDADETIHFDGKDEFFN